MTGWICEKKAGRVCCLFQRSLTMKQAGLVQVKQIEYAGRSGTFLPLPFEVNKLHCIVFYIASWENATWIFHLRQMMHWAGPGAWLFMLICEIPTGEGLGHPSPGTEGKFDIDLFTYLFSFLVPYRPFPNEYRAHDMQIS